MISFEITPWLILEGHKSRVVALSTRPLNLVKATPTALYIGLFVLFVYSGEYGWGQVIISHSPLLWKVADHSAHSPSGHHTRSLLLSGAHFHNSFTLTRDLGNQLKSVYIWSYYRTIVVVYLLYEVWSWLVRSEPPQSMKQMVDRYSKVRHGRSWLVLPVAHHY